MPKAPAIHWSAFKTARVLTNPPPGSGIMLIRMLQTLEQFDLRSLGHNTPEYISVVSEVMKRAQIDKDQLIGDPAKARRKLGWKPEVTFKQLVHLMADADLELVQQEMRHASL